jgi:N-methylhydantoinase B
MTPDPTTLAVVRGYLEEIADEMCVVQVTSSFSPVISEMADMANGIYSYDNGETVMQGRTGQPIFVAAMQASTQSLLAHVRERGDEIAAGDVFIFNDPYLGGTHLPDVKLVAPFFHEGQPLFLLGTAGHWADIGGASPGSFSPRATDILQEGMRIPPIRIARRGEPVTDVRDLLLGNTRLPLFQSGDIEAQLNVLRVADERLRQLLGRYGADTIRLCVAELRRRSEAEVRSHLSALPDGTYEFVDHLDNDGINDRPLELVLVLTIRGTDVHLDFSRSSGPSRGPFNSAAHTTISACQVAVKHLFPEVPINAGCFVPFTYDIPDTTFLGAVPPRAVGAYVEVANRVIDAIFGALAQADPELPHAASFGTGGVTIVSGEDPRHGYYVAVLPYGGGHGASARGDGLIFGTSIIGSANFPSIEALERDFPLLWRRFAIRDGSGGPGRFDGGCGTDFEFEITSPANMTVLGDRGRFPPFGIAGGGAAAGNQVSVVSDGAEIEFPLTSKGGPVDLGTGSRVALSSPGGGGYGDPLDRAPDLVARGVVRGYISVQTAREVHGVVLTDTGAVAEADTERLRRTRKAKVGGAAKGRSR